MSSSSGAGGALARIYVVEGVPGSGKTKFISSARELLERSGIGVHVFTEQIDPQFLSTYLRDPQRYAFAFQTNLAVQRVYQWERALHKVAEEAGAVVFLDRSRIGDAVFARDLHQRRFISDHEMQLYHTAVGTVGECTLATLHPPERFRVLYLRVRAAVALERVRRRGNGDEIASYSAERMQRFVDGYESVMARECAAICDSRDWNADLPLTRKGDADLLPDSALLPIFMPLLEQRLWRARGLVPQFGE